MDAKLFANLSDSIKKFDDFDVSGINLHNPPPEILVFDQDDIETHCIMQAPAIAYYGWHLSRAEAVLKQLREDYEKWFKIKKSEAGAQLRGSDPDYKPSEPAKEARVFVNCQQAKLSGGVDEDEEWKAKIRLAEEYRDTMKFWHDGFNAKNYLISTYAGVTKADGRAVSGIKAKDLTPVEQPLSGFNSSGAKRVFRRVGV